MRWGHCPASYSSGTPRLSGRSPSWPLRPFVIQPLTPAASSAPFSTVLLEGSPCSLRVLSCVQPLPSPCLNAFSYSVPRPSRSCCLRGGSSDYPVQFVCVSFFFSSTSTSWGRRRWQGRPVCDSLGRVPHNPHRRWHRADASELSDGGGSDVLGKE